MNIYTYMDGGRVCVRIPILISIEFCDNYWLWGACPCVHLTKCKQNTKKKKMRKQKCVKIKCSTYNRNGHLHFID